MHQPHDLGFWLPDLHPCTGLGPPKVVEVAWSRSEDTNGFAIDLFSPLAARYDRLCEVLSMGQNRRWRRRMVGHATASSPERVLDVASGTAGVAIQIAQHTTGRVVAYDLTLPMLRHGATRVAASGLTDRIDLVEGRAEDLPFPDQSFDALTFTYLLRYVENPAATLAELARVLKPGGSMASLEFLAPPNPLWRAAWWCYTRLVLPVAGWLTGGREWWRVGRFLGPNISGHYRDYPIPWTVRAWESAGLVDVGVRTMSLGGGLVMWGRKPGG
jgi:demethylmenaquinone methyltransferase / 2-methoxy-6-polyprenyl-1,4-benzoquinol methylase